MERYEVLAFDDQKAGHLVGREGAYLIVEHGSIFKHRRPVPEAFARVDDDARVVYLTVSKHIVETAPEIDDGGLDEAAAAEHYGLAAGFEAPETLGKGRLRASETALSAEREELDHGGLPAPMERAETQGQVARGEGPLDESPPSPGVTGGDRRRDSDPGES